MTLDNHDNFGGHAKPKELHHRGRTLRVKASIDRAIWMCKSPKQACLDSDVICVDLAPRSLTTENVAEAIGQLIVLLIFNLANRFNSHWD